MRRKMDDLRRGGRGALDVKWEKRERETPVCKSEGSRCNKISSTGELDQGQNWILGGRERLAVKNRRDETKGSGTANEVGPRTRAQGSKRWESLRALCQGRTALTPWRKGRLARRALGCDVVAKIEQKANISIPDRLFYKRGPEMGMKNRSLWAKKKTRKQRTGEANKRKTGKYKPRRGDIGRTFTGKAERAGREAACGLRRERRELEGGLLTRSCKHSSTGRQGKGTSSVETGI